ncbi:MAG TPA: hypothetical protein VE177_03185, partial [Candidatus Binatus sp.]|nr:hypothetical protein [Candidatus Binatus sp.]
VAYPSVSFQGSNSLAGTYSAWVDESMPSIISRAASASFTITITDNSSYERTQTVNMHASGYNASESVSINIRTQTTSTVVFSQTLSASPTGIVSTTWKIPVNETIDNYLVRITGTSTLKNPSDSQIFSVRAAVMSITTITSSKSTYQRTETMRFSFQPKYPDGSTASTGIALLTLAGPVGGSVTLPATYNGTDQTFGIVYKTARNNETGTWTATLAGHGYSDGFGNTGPGATLNSSPTLTSAILSIIVITNNNNFGIGQSIRFNATISFPDGTILQSGNVGAYLLYSNPQQTVNDTVGIVYDTGLNTWVGTYTPKATDTGGLWSLIVRASDSTSPPDIGVASRAITIQNIITNPSSDNSLPLYYYGILVALIAGILIIGFLAFRRRKTSHTSLKIDIDAVKSEAGKIESQEFFKSVKDQLKKDFSD